MFTRQRRKPKVALRTVSQLTCILYGVTSLGLAGIALVCVTAAEAIPTVKQVAGVSFFQVALAYPCKHTQGNVPTLYEDK